MPTDKSSNTAAYAGIGTGEGASSAVPIPAPGIGTRISDLSKRIGTREFVSNVIGVSAPQLQRYIREQNAAPFEAMARLCLAAGASMEWLATGIEVKDDGACRNPPSQSQDLNQDRLILALQAVDDALATRDAYLPVAKHAEAVMLVYELLGSGLPEAEVIPFARRAVGLAQGGAVDGKGRAAGTGR
ncbi:MAG: hypothetical protein ACRES5_05590 [Pseudomonas sp.]|uniref:hypothetical protein n=1 Tax=Stenotrophomonas sp. TaxID=69392 RepID=UPI003D6DA25B